MIEIGPARFELHGNSGVADSIRRELGHSGVPANANAFHLSFDLKAGGSSLLPGVKSRSAADSRAPFRFASSTAEGRVGLALSLKWFGLRLYEVDIPVNLAEPTSGCVGIRVPSVEKISTLAKPLTGIGTRDGLSLEEIVAKNVIYEILDPIAWIRLLALGGTMVHSSCLAVADRCLMFMGGGGAGKTTTLLALMREWPTARYISDDLMVLLRDGSVHRHPKRLQIYEYNLIEASDLRSVVWRHLSRARRRVWTARATLFGSAQARVRISAEDLFGVERVTDSQQLTHAVWVTPSSGEHSWSEVTPQEMARRSSAAILAEFWDFLRLYNASTLLVDEVQKVEDLLGLSTEVVAEGLEGVTCLELKLPQGGLGKGRLEGVIGDRLLG